MSLDIWRDFYTKPQLHAYLAKIFDLPIEKWTLPWLLSEARAREIFVKLSERYPQKRNFSWLLSEGTSSCCQMNFWKNVKVFTSNCRVIMRGLFYKCTQSLFCPQNIFANVYILQSRVLVYMEGFKEENIKL